MELSVFLAKVLGLYLVIVVPAALLNRRHFPRLIKEFSDSLAMVVLSGGAGVGASAGCRPQRLDRRLESNHHPAGVADVDQRRGPVRIPAQGCTSGDGGGEQLVGCCNRRVLHRRRLLNVQGL